MQSLGMNRANGLFPDSNGELTVWYHPFREDGGEYSQLLKYLSSEERERFRRFRKREAAVSYLVGRAGLRYLLSQTAEKYGLSLDLKSWELAQNRYGKPRIAGELDRLVKFNLSHTRGLVGWLVGTCSPGQELHLGIDLEDIRRRANWPLLAEHHFSREERRAIAGRPGEYSKKKLFFTYWTLKEAVLKALGIGLQVELSELDFHSFTPPERGDYLEKVELDFLRIEAVKSSADRELLKDSELPWGLLNLEIISFALGEWVGAAAALYGGEKRNFKFNLKRLEFHF